MLIRYFKSHGLRPLVAIVLSASAITLVNAKDNIDPANTMAIGDTFRNILENSHKESVGKFGGDMDWLTQVSKKLGDKDKKAIDEIVSGASKSAAIDPIKQKKPYSTLVFVSYSMPNNELLEVMNQVAGDKEALIVMRGIPEGYTITEGIQNMQNLAASFEKTPNIALDPTAFKKYGITAVPSIVLLEKNDDVLEPLKDMPNNQDEAFELLSNAAKKGSAKDKALKNDNSYLAKVAGISNISWLKNQVKNGNEGDLGKKGPTLDIAEPDLIEVMKEKVTKIDWNEKRENAIKNYWPGQDFLTLPEAKVARTRKIDASITVTDDIRTPTGKFIAKKGDRVNPLQTRPFTQAIVIFDGRSEAQINTVINSLDAIKSKVGVQKIVFIASAMDKEEGWDGFKDLTNRLDSNLFVLTPDIRTRFAIERVPSVITADDTHFIVEELPVKQIEEKLNEEANK